MRENPLPANNTGIGEGDWFKVSVPVADWNELVLSVAFSITRRPIVR